MRSTGWTWRGGLAVAGAVLLAACGDDPIAPGDDLSSAEAEAISQFVIGETFDAWESEVVGDPSASRAPRMSTGAPIQIDFSVDASVGCPNGGTLAVSGAIQGSVDDETQSGALSLGITTSASSCAFPAEGTVFTIDTSPDLQLDGQFAWANGVPVGEQTFSYTGGVLWSAADGRSGNCAFDLQMTRSEDGTLVESGTVCGASLEA